MNTATQRQRDLIRSLLDERKGNVDAQNIRTYLNNCMQEGCFTVAVASDAIDELFSIERNVTTPAVPDGRYAIELDGTLHFFHVRSPQDGKWAGYTFVDERRGPNVFPVKDASRRRGILVLLAGHVHEALARYGQELGICGCCGLELTNEESRRIGIGPVCRQGL